MQELLLKNQLVWFDSHQLKAKEASDSCFGKVPFDPDGLKCSRQKHLAQILRCEPILEGNIFLQHRAITKVFIYIYIYILIMLENFCLFQIDNK